MRFIIITSQRARFIEEMTKQLLGDQFGDSFVMLNTSFSYRVFYFVPREITRINKIKLPSEKFDHLLGLTYSLLNHDVWMNDYEYTDTGTLKSLLTRLGNSWKSIIHLTDEELGIDSEFTRPGIEALLKEFAKTAFQGPDNMKFKWHK